MGTFAGSTFGIGTQGAFPGQGIGFSPWQSASYFGGGVQPAQQILQLLQIVPQQLQQWQVLQQQQLAHVQQLLQLVPAQLQQLQQLIQIVPQQVQYLQQQGQPFGSAISGPIGFGLTPQGFGGPGSGNVM